MKMNSNMKTKIIIKIETRSELMIKVTTLEEIDLSNSTNIRRNIK